MWRTRSRFRDRRICNRHRRRITYRRCTRDSGWSGSNCSKRRHDGDRLRGDSRWGRQAQRRPSASPRMLVSLRSELHKGPTPGPWRLARMRRRERQNSGEANATAVGDSARANAATATAVGANATANGPNSAAFGQGTHADLTMPAPWARRL